jgi:hypothetical protein
MIVRLRKAVVSIHLNNATVDGLNKRNLVLDFVKIGSDMKMGI